ncbi:MAG: tRNA lysidine(34) synthetase TilS [Bacteroides sp.]|nr:tRNA lysidine(34) synthetase TilS [Bacteroides sp.]MCM1379951.1 tRNA lysidine(34) synthetase TilS [Bacteroides sp.]MCM1446294.1 tRNA lysidine(34) synthetase TilS [Prevotella sp.]
MKRFAFEVKRYIEAERLLSPGAKIVVGLSGGADSTALLAVLCELGYECIAVNCNFGLRGAEAERDSLHARHTAQLLGAKFFRKDFDAKKYAADRGISLEMACRDLRYDYFAQFDADAIAVGHHREDNVETFFLNLLRGSGIHGLRGILPRRDKIIRPLLNSTRAEIVAYLQERGLEYVVDSSNLENDFMRNRLRNVVLPLLEREFPGASAKIAESISLLRANEQLYNSLLPARPERLVGQSPTLIFEWLAPYGFNACQCAKISTAHSGAVFTSLTHKLTICPKGKYNLESTASQPCRRPKLQGHYLPFTENFRPRPGVLYLDAEALPFDGEWELRPWQPGDRMRPFGMRGNRPVSDILADAGVPADRRAQTYVLTLNGEILWAVGYRTSAYYPITNYTTEILEISNEEI